jgi:hypothetical protein
LRDAKPTLCRNPAGLGRRIAPATL